MPKNYRYIWVREREERMNKWNKHINKVYVEKVNQLNSTIGYVQ